MATERSTPWGWQQVAEVATLVGQACYWGKVRENPQSPVGWLAVTGPPQEKERENPLGHGQANPWKMIFGLGATERSTPWGWQQVAEVATLM